MEFWVFHTVADRKIHGKILYEKNVRKIHKKATRKKNLRKKCVYFIERNKLGHHVFNSNFPDLHKKNRPRETNKKFPMRKVQWIVNREIL